MRYVSVYCPQPGTPGWPSLVRLHSPNPIIDLGCSHNEGNAGVCSVVISNFPRPSNVELWSAWAFIGVKIKVMRAGVFLDSASRLGFLQLCYRLSKPSAIFGRTSCFHHASATLSCAGLILFVVNGGETPFYRKSEVRRSGLLCCPQCWRQHGNGSWGRPQILQNLGGFKSRLCSSGLSSKLIIHNVATTYSSNYGRLREGGKR